MANNTVGRGSDQIKLRLPDGMRDELKEAAKVNGRSMNAEIIARLKKCFAMDTEKDSDIIKNVNVVVAHIAKDSILPAYHVFGDNVRMFVVDENVSSRADRVREMSYCRLEKLRERFPGISEVCKRDNVLFFPDIKK